MGERGGELVEVDLTRAGGLHLAGGANSAERALMLNVLRGAELGQYLVILVREDLHQLLGDAAMHRAESSSGLLVAATAADALDLLGAELIERSTALDDHHADLEGTPETTTLPLVCLINPAEHRARLKADLQLGMDRAVGAIIVGEWPHGTTLAVDSSGVIVDATGQAADGLLGTQITLTGDAATSESAFLVEDSTVAESEVTPARGATSAVEQPPGFIRLFGGGVVEGPAGREGSRSSHVWALMGLLVEHRGRGWRTREALEDKLGWGASSGSPERFNTALRGVRAMMCTALGRPTNQGRTVIVQAPYTGYRINGALFTCALWRLLDLIAQTPAADGRAKTAALTEAVDLYQGAYLPELHSDHLWALETDRTTRRKVVEALTALAGRESGPVQAVMHLERATELEPTATHLYRQRMKCYAELGQTLLFHHCYEELHEGLRKVGQKPDPQTAELYKRLTDSN